MAEIKRSILFGKLNSIAYKAVESATIFCKLRGNPYVELVHWLHQMFQLNDSDQHRIVTSFEINPSRVATDLITALDKLPRGATSISDFSPHLEEAVERGWVFGSLLFGDTQIRTGHIVVGLLKTPHLRNVFLSLSKEFTKIKLDRLTDEFSRILSGSPEELLGAAEQAGGEGAVPGETSGAIAPAVMGKQEALARFSVDLTEKAHKGEIDPILGRDDEIRQIIDILMRRRQNNPILTGEAGVGKTAVVEGFALRIAGGDVPPALRGVTVRTLDLGLLQAGASMKGEFENRVRQVIEEVQASPKPIILFIDEAHTLIGAGGAAGQGDAANLLKPALARGTLRTIAATTWAEYKKYIEKDPALTRRFQVIKVEEPDEAKTVLMIRGLAPVLEKHHRVHLLDEALEAAARLSHRYIPSRQLPDKAVSLIDTACARVAISQYATPPALEDCQHRIAALQAELAIVERETAIGIDHQKRQAEIERLLTTENERLAELAGLYKREKGVVDEVLEIRKKLRRDEKVRGSQVATPSASQARQRSTGGDPLDRRAETAADIRPVTKEEREALLSKLKGLEKELSSIQGEAPLILPSVDEQAVASVVADWTGIPVGRMVKNEIQAVLTLADNLERRVVGQRHGLEAIAKRIQTSRAGLDNPSKPIGVFLLAGPSGVGKTETALALAETLYGGESNIITINMSEFQEAHTVSTLKGAPPGYVGYGEGGILTEAVRRKPYSVVLLDEVEKAHSDVHEIFFQVFDKGVMEDGEGRLIDFKNTIILLTTNVGSDLIMNLCKEPEMMPSPEGITKALRPSLLKVFPAALLGRLVVIPYYPLSDGMLKSIIRLQLSRIQQRISDGRDITLNYEDAVVDLIASRCTELESGGRMVDAILTHTLLPEISRELLNRLMEGTQPQEIQVTVKEGKFAYDYA
ncbi:MAG: type VI secretion system ATPase TssH [Verrucomicrobia bacterium]|nr:type VI secretion system ATPase TssH [Verrucomicrobiota bacterium]